MLRYIIGALILINLIGFFITGLDKHKARNKKRRIPEKTFFIVSILGGCPGVYAGLLSFRHKTRHWYFMWGIPFIFAVQVTLAYFIYIRK